MTDKIEAQPTHILFEYGREFVHVPVSEAFAFADQGGGRIGWRPLLIQWSDGRRTGARDVWHDTTLGWLLASVTDVETGGLIIDRQPLQALAQRARSCIAATDPVPPMRGPMARGFD